jgi:hypothetical protein
MPFTQRAQEFTTSMHMAWKYIRLQTLIIFPTWPPEISWFTRVARCGRGTYESTLRRTASISGCVKHHPLLISKGRSKSDCKFAVSPCKGLAL